MKRYIFLLSAVVLAGCVKMDVPRKNTITEEVLMSNAAGMDVYVARIMALQPIEDFKYQNEWGLEANGWLGALDIDGAGVALNRDGICRQFTSERSSYWNDDDKATAQPFKALKDINTLIENFPAYEGNFTPIQYKNYLGIAYFARANIFYAMAKRFGGIPLVTRVINYPDDADGLEIPRASEEETWDQIAADFDRAAELLMDTADDITLPSRWVALALKAEAMNYAGCVAKYNSEYGLTLNSLAPGARTGVKVIGFADPATASRKYFSAAYAAASEIITGGRHQLYTAASNDPEDTYKAMNDMFSGNLANPALLRNNKENMWVREYLYPTIVHVIDAFSSPAQFRARGFTLSGGTCPTLDFVELFDGLPRNAEGRIKVTSGNTNAEGNYLMFDSPMDLFRDVEPRLRAQVILPFDTFKGEVIQIYGTYTGTEASIAPLGNSNGGYGYNNAGTHYNSYAQFNNTLFFGKNMSENTTVPYNGGNPNITVTGGTMTASGGSGPFWDNAEAALSGFTLRKWLNPDPAFIGGNDAGANAAQPFILIRYADVLLAAAEAAVELAIAGGSSPDGTDMLAVATKAIKDIQTRAGATVMTGSLSGNTDSRDIVRKERRKELAFEHKSKWDVRRWRVLHREGRDYFWGVKGDAAKFSDGAGTQYRFRGLYPFFSTAHNKFFFDDRFQFQSLKTFDYNPVDYYFEVPSGEVAKSMSIDQQPNRL